MLMVPLAVYEWPDRADSSKSRVLSGTVEWATGIFTRLELAGSPLVEFLGWPRRIMRIVRREIGEDEPGRGRAGGGGEGGFEEAEEDVFAGLGVSVLKLGLPISPSVEGEGGSEEDANAVLAWDGHGGLVRFWDDEVGGSGGGVGELVDPVLVTTLGMDGGGSILTMPSSAAPLPVIHGPTDLDMEML